MNGFERKIMDFLLQNPKVMISEVAEEFNINRITASKYLFSLRDQGRADYKPMGPCKAWFLLTEEQIVEKKIGDFLVKAEDVMVTVSEFNESKYLPYIREYEKTTKKLKKDLRSDLKKLEDRKKVLVKQGKFTGERKSYYYQRKKELKKLLK